MNVADDDVHALGKHDLGRWLADELHAIGEAVAGCEQSRELQRRTRLDGEDAPRAGPAGDEGEDSGSGSEIDDGVAGFDTSRNRGRELIQP